MLQALVVLVLLGGTASAQSPRAGGPAPGDDPSSRIAVEGALTGNIARGFVDRELLSSRGVLQAWAGPWGFYIQPYWLYGRVGTPMGKLTTDNEIYVRNGLFRALTGPLFAYGVSVYDRSVRRQIEHRNLAGAGLGVNLWQCKGSSLLTSAGLLYEVTDFSDELAMPVLQDGDGGHQFDGKGIRKTARWSIRLYGRYKIGDGKLGILHDLIVIPSFRDPRYDYRVLFYGAIDAPIAKGFSARISADATHEGLIVTGTKNGDLAVTFGVAYRNEWPPRKSPPSKVR